MDQPTLNPFTPRLHAPLQVKIDKIGLWERPGFVPSYYATLLISSRCIQSQYASYLHK